MRSPAQGQRRSRRSWRSGSPRRWRPRTRTGWMPRGGRRGSGGPSPDATTRSASSARRERGSGSVNDPRAEPQAVSVLTWPPRPGAAEYRVLVRDDTRRELVLKSAALGECTFALPKGLVDDPARFRWRVQHRLGPGGDWVDVGPYLAMPWAPPAERALTLEWPDRGAPAYRLAVRDDHSDEIVIKDAVPGTAWVLDSARLNPAHRHRYKVQTFTDERWFDCEPYRSL